MGALAWLREENTSRRVCSDQAIKLMEYMSADFYDNKMTDFICPETYKETQRFPKHAVPVILRAVPTFAKITKSRDDIRLLIETLIDPTCDLKGVLCYKDRK